MVRQAPERRQLAAFFRHDDIIERPAWLILPGLLQFAAVFGAGFWVMEYDRPGRPDIAGFPIMEGILAASVVWLITSLIILSIEILYKLIERAGRSSRQKSLEQKARQTLLADYKRALKAMLRDSGLRPDELRRSSETSSPAFESLLFDQKELDDFLGPLKDQTFRAVTPDTEDVQFAPRMKDMHSGAAQFSAYFTPFRLTCVFFTKTGIVFGQALCDALTGELKVRTRRIEEDEIASAEFVTTDEQVEVSQSLIDKWLHNRRLDGPERQRVRGLLKHHAASVAKARRQGWNLSASPFVFWRLLKRLDIRRKSGNVISVPVSIEQHIARAERTADYEQRSVPVISTSFGDLGDETILDITPEDEETAANGTDAGEIFQTRPELWSSGRQATHREYNAFWSFFRSAAASILFGLSALWMMSLLINRDTTETTSSETVAVETEATGIPGALPETNIPETEAAPEAEATLTDEPSAAPEAEATPETVSELVPGCTLIATDVLEAARFGANRLTRLESGSALEVWTDENAARNGWSRVEVLIMDQPVEGFVRSADIVISPDSDGSDCAG